MEMALYVCTINEFPGISIQGTVRCGAVRCGAVRCGTVRYGTVRYGTLEDVSKNLTRAFADVASLCGQMAACLRTDSYTLLTRMGFPPA